MMQELCECGQPRNSIRHSFTTANSVDAHEFKPISSPLGSQREDALTKLGNYTLRHGDVIDASWCAKVLEEAREAQSALLERIRELEAELGMVDEALARRPALADAPNRYTAISRACAKAGKADAAERRVAELEAENQRMTDAWLTDETIQPDGSLRATVKQAIETISFDAPSDYLKGFDEFSSSYENILGDRDAQEIINDIRG